MSINSIKLISWNIKGISNKVKRYKVLSHLRSLSCDVAMLQEVHVKETEVMKLRQRWVGQVFSSPGNGAILIISGYLQNQKCTLVNIYAPNTGQIDFLSSLTVVLPKFAGDPILVGGDFNMTGDPLLDRSKRPLPSDRALSAAFTEFKNTLALTDVWRTLNPMTREYSFYSKVHNSYSRIDFLLLPKELLENVIDSQIHRIIISDHAPVPESIVKDLLCPRGNVGWEYLAYTCII
uniref:exodeoxyribonuclease III n=1 Tax=Neogobius melanostomus TaxID=47308 RepID=A0A8C6UMX8_9GOBI